MLDAKALLLVDDAQSQILKFHILLHQTVGTHHNIDLSAAQLLQHLLLLPWRAKARENVHLDRKALHPLAEGLVMLPGKDGGRHQHRTLFAVHHTFKGGADGNLGLSKANVPAQQTVHRGGLFHIVLDFPDAAQLVVGFVVGKAALKVVLPVGVRSKGIALCRLPLGIQLDQLIRHILDRFFDPGAGLCPLGGVELVELDHAVLLAADVLGDKVQLGDRHKQHIAAGIANLDVVLDYAVDIALDNSLKDANSVGNVYHIVAHIQVRNIFDSALFGFCRLFAAAAGFGMADDRQLQLRILHARRQSPFQHIDSARVDGRNIPNQLCRKVLLQILGQRLRSSGCARKDDTAKAGLHVVLDVIL